MEKFTGRQLKELVLYIGLSRMMHCYSTLTYVYECRTLFGNKECYIIFRI